MWRDDLRLEYPFQSCDRPLFVEDIRLFEQGVRCRRLGMVTAPPHKATKRLGAEGVMQL